MRRGLAIASLLPDIHNCFVSYLACLHLALDSMIWNAKTGRSPLSCFT